MTLCPLMYNAEHGSHECNEEACAWWICDMRTVGEKLMDIGSCALRVLADNVEIMVRGGC